jgi:hypothetical protein
LEIKGSVLAGNYFREKKSRVWITLRKILYKNVAKEGTVGSAGRFFHKTAGGVGLSCGHGLGVESAVASSA